MLQELFVSMFSFWGRPVDVCAYVCVPSLSLSSTCLHHWLLVMSLFLAAFTAVLVVALL